MWHDDKGCLRSIFELLESYDKGKRPGKILQLGIIFAVISWGSLKKFHSGYSINLQFAWEEVGWYTVSFIAYTT